MAAALLGCTRSVDVLIYKVDRLGDWLLAEPTIRLIADATRARHGSVVVWAARESEAFRVWRRPDFKVEVFTLDPRGLLAKIRRAFIVVQLLSVYRPRTFICLRYTPEPVRDFVLSHVFTDEIYALSRCLISTRFDEVPNEIARHFAILTSAALQPADARELLPRLPVWKAQSSGVVVLAPFGSAPIRDWSDGAWCEVVAGLAARRFLFELWVGPDQLTRAEGLVRKLSKRAPETRTSVMSGTLAELADAIRSATLVLTVETFAAHLAAAMDAPTVCLVGGGHYGDFGPWHNSMRQRWVTHLLPCFGCDWRCSRSRVECLKDIHPATILSEIENVLSSPSN
jgi:ADP-heptose:LPS heptosyltransferase